MYAAIDQRRGGMLTWLRCLGARGDEYREDRRTFCWLEVSHSSPVTKEVRKYIIASDQPIKLEIINATKMSQLIKLSEGRPDPRACPSTMMIRASKFKHRRKRIFILGTVLTFKPAHVFNYIIPAMASTRGCLLFNCFRAHVHASTRWLQSKEVPFRVQQPLRNVPVWPWATR